MKKWLPALLLGVALGAPSVIYAQGEEEKGRDPLMGVADRLGGGEMLDRFGIDISGHAEVSYTWSDSSPPDGSTNEDFLTGRVFDVQHDEFYLNQIDVTIQRPLEASDDPVLGYADKLNVGFKVEWLYGYDARFIHANGLLDHYVDDTSRNEEFDLTQAYVTVGVPVGNGLLVTGGKFVTLLGFETINPTINPLYSHSYLFGFAIPFTHTGVTARYDFTDRLNVTAGVVRGWEQALQDNNEGESFIGQVGYTVSDRLNLILTGITGPEQADVDGNFRTVIDLIAAYKFSDELTLALNADYGYEDDAAIGGDQAQWYGAAGYASYALNERCAVNARAEWFSDKDGARGLGTNVYEATLGLAIKPFPENDLGSNLVFRPEIRYDYAQEGVFDDGTDHDQFTIGADVIFTF